MITYIKHRYSNHYFDPMDCRKAIARMLLLLAALATSGWAANSRAEQEQLNEPNSGHLILKTDSGKKQNALHLQSAVHFDIRGLHAKVTLTQTFSNSSLEWVEGIYKFPLPPNSAVNAMTMTIGDRIVKGEIREKQQAKQLYTQAKKAGKKAALVEQERPNMFTQSVANIGPGESVSVELSYLQNIRYDMGEFSLRFPMTITPRYIPGTIPGTIRAPDQAELSKPLLEEDALSHQLHTNAMGWAMPTHQVPDAHRITPFQTHTKHPIQISATVEAGMALDDLKSPSHNVLVNQLQAFSYSVEPVSASVAMDRDFELVWRVKQGDEPTAAVFHEQLDSQSYVQVMLLPPYVEQKLTMPRELVIVVDTSGSMAGTSIEQAKQSVHFALGQLSPHDQFNIIQFNSNYQPLFRQSEPATNEKLDRAKHFVNSLGAGGGTEMASALRAALRVNENTENYLRQVVFITDGAVGNEEALFKLINEDLGKSRLFTVGIGSAPNSYFMERAAEFGRGTFTHISDVTQVDERMRALLRKLASPALAGVQIHWPQGFGGEQYPNNIPDLYLGEPLVVNAQFAGNIGEGDIIEITGKTADQSWNKQLASPKPSPVEIGGASDHQGAIVSTLWARSKLKHLLQQKIQGTAEEDIREQALPLALRFQLMSPYTSFLAIEEVISRPAEQSLSQQAVANTVPYGQKPQALSYPSTATPALFKLLLGAIAALALALLKGQGRLRHAL